MISETAPSATGRFANRIDMAFPPLGPTRPHTMPLFQSAVYDVPDLDVLDRVMNGEEPGFLYARDAHPSSLTSPGSS